MTLLTREPSADYKNMILHPFWEYANLFQNFSLYSAHDIVLNIGLFIPFGFSVPLCFPKMRKLKHMAFCGMLVSSCIELTQLIFSLGWCEIDDVFNNTVGACIGFGLYKILDRTFERVK
jgi:glycopeptide antibiotics resistance protein